MGSIEKQRKMSLPKRATELKKSFFTTNLQLKTKCILANLGLFLISILELMRLDYNFACRLEKML